ncbi:hypothetical protein MAR_019648, partial [Mya arenaria]
MGSGCHGTLVGHRKLGGDRSAGGTQVTLLAVGCLLWVSFAQTSDAHNACRTTNTTLPEMYLGSTPKERIRLVGSTGPLWLMGLEVVGRVNGDGRWHGVLYLNSTDKANVVCGGDVTGQITYADAKRTCSDKAPMLSVTASNISHTAQERDQLNSTDGTDVQILCYILTETGEIQTDNCTNSSLAPVVRYFGNKTFPFKRYSSHTTHGGMDKNLLIPLVCAGAVVLLAVVIAVCR